MSRLTLPLLACAALLIGLAPAATAAPQRSAARVDYVALGDSYAAGVGAEPDGRSGACRRSDRSYPARFAAAREPATFVSVACSGATSGIVMLRQVRTVSRATDLVTITVGGNDAGFSPIIGTCSTAPDDGACATAVTRGERVARYAVPLGLGAIVAAVRAQAPGARIVVVGYPRLFADGPDCDVPLAPNATRRAALNRAADTLDRTLRETATRLGATWVDVAAGFRGHAVCDADPWINPPTDPPTSASYHPSSRGYADGYLPALAAATGH